MSKTDPFTDWGIPLPGSDRVRRARIKQEINRMKRYLILFRLMIGEPDLNSQGDADQRRVLQPLLWLPDEP